MIGSRTITLRFPVNWLVAIVIFAIAFVLVYILGPERWHPFVIFGTSVAGGSAALIAAANALDARVSGVQQARITAALGFIASWLNPHFFHAKTSGRQILNWFKEHPNGREQLQYVDADPTLRANLSDVLNVFEALAIAIDVGMIDEEVAKRFFRSIVREWWHQTESYIKARRAERDNTRLFKEFEWLFERWKT